MIILFHMAYVIASSLMNIITRPSSFFNTTNFQQIGCDDIQEDQINEPVPEQDSSARSIYVHDEVCQVMQQMNGKSSEEGLGLGLLDEEQTTDGSCLRPRPHHIQGDGQGYLTAQPYVSAGFENEDCDVDFRPIPPVYAQRYLAVKSVLLDEKWKGQIKKVIDFGCNDLAFFQYVKHMKGVEEVLMVDIDEALLVQSSCRAAPLNCDYLLNRESPLLVQILGGSIAEQDRRLIGTDAVICIELIEHLWPDEVEAVPYTVFGFVLPKVAIFTTPNADFNVVFKNFSGFRHPDHKFEWTREQFECWANNIVQRYPAYEVTFHGIGAGPPGTEVYGCCSQMAVFAKRLTDVQQSKIESVEVYKLIRNYDYPFRVDSRSTEEKIRHEAEYYIHRYSKDEVHCLDDGNIEIPLIVLLPHVEKWCVSVDDLRRVLEGGTWKISDRNPETPAVIYPYYCAYSSSDDEDGEYETPFPSRETITDGYLQSTKDWDDCTVDSGSCSSEQLRDEVDSCQSETHVSLTNNVAREIRNVKERSTPRLVSAAGNSEQCSCGQGVTSLKPSGSACAVNGEGRETTQLGTLFRSDSVVSKGDSAIVMGGRPSRVRSLEEVSQPTYHAPGGGGVETGLSSESLLGSESSRSFFLGLLSSERRAAEQGMDLEPDEGGEEEEEDSEEEEEESSSSGHSQEGGGYRRGGSPPPPRRRPAQPHRNPPPFGLNAVENGDVANNNRDGEGNNAMPLEDEDLGLLPPLELFFDDDEAGDHDDDFDDDLDNAPLLPDHADPFPPWLLHLLQVANDDGIELGAAGEPHIFLGDL